MDSFAVLASQASHMCDNLKLLQKLCNQLRNVVPSGRVGQRRACAARQLPTRSGPRFGFESRNEAIRFDGLVLNVLVKPSRRFERLLEKEEPCSRDRFQATWFQIRNFRRSSGFQSLSALFLESPARKPIRSAPLPSETGQHAMCPAVDNDFLPTSQVHWNAAYYGAMAVASSATEAVQKKAREIAFPLRLWNVARKMRDVVEIIEHPELTGKNSSSSSSEKVDPEKFVCQIDSLVETVDDFYEKCRRIGFTNRTLTASQLQSIRTYNEDIRDFGERVRLMLDPRTKETFRRAKENRELQGTVSASSLF